MKSEARKPDRIVAAGSGEMAYEYGTRNLSFDEVGSGKHVVFTAAYLRVWRTIDGSCKQAALMFERKGTIDVCQFSLIAEKGGTIASVDWR